MPSITRRLLHLGLAVLDGKQCREAPEEIAGVVIAYDFDMTVILGGYAGEDCHLEPRAASGATPAVA
ncbi:MAG: hypothetical protein WAS21_03920 [Geminicoccaceae bacterium]